MTTLLYTHPACLEHDTGFGHPESPARLTAILNALRAAPFAALEWRDAPRATAEQLTRIHPQPTSNGFLPACPGRVISRSTATPSCRRNRAKPPCARRARCARRWTPSCGGKPATPLRHPPTGPSCRAEPGHGLCLFGNAAIGAAHARAVHGLKRVAIIDFDVHHGNGTQAAVERDPGYLYISTHQAYIYPGTGHRGERGIGNIINIPLLAGSGSTDLRHVWRHEIEPALREFKPQLILISAGFDAHHMDPLAELNFSEDDYAWLTRRILRSRPTTARARWYPSWKAATTCRPRPPAWRRMSRR